MIYVYFFIKCVVRWSQNPVRLSSYGNWLPDGPNSVRFYFTVYCEIWSHSVRYGIYEDSGYPHDGRADKNPYPYDRHADKDSYPHDSNNQCIILRLQLSFMMINEQMMLV